MIDASCALLCTLRHHGGLFFNCTQGPAFDFMMTLVTSLGVWGMPGQVAFASLYSAGASLFMIFVAVSLANMRMLLMVISAADMIGTLNHMICQFETAVLDAVSGYNGLGASRFAQRNIHHIYCCPTIRAFP